MLLAAFAARALPFALVFRATAIDPFPTLIFGVAGNYRSRL
jgi:hypothetical protein